MAEEAVLEQVQEIDKQAAPKTPEAEPAPKAKEETKAPDKHDELPKGVQRTINRLTRQRSELMGVIQQQDERLARLEQSLTVRSEANKTDDEKGPQQDAYATYDEYVDARVNWIAERKVKERLQAEEQEATRSEQEENSRKTFQAYQERVEEARERYTDWDDVREDAKDMSVPESVQLALMEIDNGPDIIYHLAKNPEVCESLSKMSPLRAVAEVGKISAELSKTHKAKVTSKAAAPVTPVQSGSSASSVPLNKMSFQDFTKARNAERKSKGLKIF